MLNLNAAALESAALSGPINEPLHLVAIFPHQMEELGCIKRSGFGSEKGLEPPAEVRASPGIQAITASYDPVVSEHLPHLGLRIQTCACNSSKRLASHRG